jgi:tRNA (guanine6-N2)-methyltransferase
MNRAGRQPLERRPPAPRPLRFGPRLFIAQTQPGFEAVAWSEIEARLPSAREQARRQVGDRAGLSIFTTSTPQSLRSLRCAEDVLLLAGYRYGLSGESAGLDQIRSASREAPFVEEALSARVFFQPAARAGRRLRFRVVARQVGEHEFRRVDLQRVVELGIAERRDHTWRLDEDAADVEFWATQIGSELFLGIRLSDERMRHRDYKIAHRPGSLRPAVAAAMAWLSDPRDEDIFLDPFCGVGTVLIERAHLGRYRNLIGSDRDPGAIRAARKNIGPRFKPVELHEDWDARALPLADASVTKIATNLPWGIKHGSHAVNRRRYGDWLAEMNRVLTPEGKMVLLTAEWRLMRDLIERGALSVQKISRVMVLGAPASLYLCKKGLGASHHTALKPARLNSTRS